VKEGFLKKNSPSFFKGWQKRRVTLKDREFRYFKEATGHPDGQLCGVINFDLYNVLLQKEKDNFSFTMTIKGCDRSF